jgi:hypothetical protein
MGTDGSAPPGTVLINSGVWYDGGVQFRSGGSVTQATGNTATFNGTVNISGATSLGGSSIDDVTEAISPSSYGLIAYNYPYLFATGTGSGTVTGGKLYLAKLPLAGGTLVTNIWFSIATAASGLTTAENFAGL